VDDEGARVAEDEIEYIVNADRSGDAAMPPAGVRSRVRKTAAIKRVDTNSLAPCSPWARCRRRS
jgi:hypothetical protein